MAEEVDTPFGGRAGHYERGLIVEYAATPRPLVLPFLFNPSTVTCTRSVIIKTGGSPGARGGYSFATPDQTPRASQGATPNAESISFKILLDATDRMNNGERIANQNAIDICLVENLGGPMVIAGHHRYLLFVSFSLFKGMNIHLLSPVKLDTAKFRNRRVCLKFTVLSESICRYLSLCWIKSHINIV